MPKDWWLLPDSNWGHKALQASALPTELKSQGNYRVQQLYYLSSYLLTSLSLHRSFIYIQIKITPCLEVI